MMSGSRTTLDSGRHEHGSTSHRRFGPKTLHRTLGKKTSLSPLDVLTRGTTMLLAGAASLPGAQGSDKAAGRKMLQECSQPQAVGVDAFSYALPTPIAQGLPATVGAVSSGNAWGMFAVNRCHERLGSVSGPINMTYTFAAPQGTSDRTDISHVRAVDAAQQDLVSQVFGKLNAGLNVQFIAFNGTDPTQANLQVVQADAPAPKVPATTYSLGPGNGQIGQTTSQLVVVGNTAVDVLQGIGGALGLTAFNQGIVKDANLSNDSDGWLTTVMGLRSTPCFPVSTYGASDWSALQTAYGLAPTLTNGTALALRADSPSGGLLGSGGNNTLSATFDGPVVLNLGNAPTDISHIGEARVALAPSFNATVGDLRATQGGYLIGNNLTNTLLAGGGNTIIDPLRGINSTVVAGPAQDIVVLHNVPGALTINDFQLNQDRLGLQFTVPPADVGIQDTSAQNGQIQLSFPGGPQVTLTDIAAHAFAGLPTLNAILLQDFTYVLPQDCQQVSAFAPAPSAATLSPTPGLAPAPAPAPQRAPSPSPSPPSPPPSPPGPSAPREVHHHGHHLGVDLGLGLGLGIPGLVAIVGSIVFAACRRHHGKRDPSNHPAPAPNPPGPGLPPSQPQANGPFYEIALTRR